MTCNKLRFQSRSEARRFIRDERKRTGGLRAQHVYECPDPGCKGWHLTSQTKAVARAISKRNRPSA